MSHGHAVKEEEMNSKKEIISPKEMKVSRQIPRVIVKGIPPAWRHTGLAHEREKQKTPNGCLQKRQHRYVNRRPFPLGRCRRS